MFFWHYTKDTGITFEGTIPQIVPFPDQYATIVVAKNDSCLAL